MRTLQVDAPATKVFDALTDIDNAPKWMPNIQKIEWRKGDKVALGAVWKETRVEGKRTVTADIEVKQLVPNKKLDLHVTAGAFEMDLVFRLTARGKATTLDYDCHGHGKGLMGLMTGIIMKHVEKNDDDFLRRFKAHVEEK